VNSRRGPMVGATTHQTTTCSSSRHQLHPARNLLRSGSSGRKLQRSGLRWRGPNRGSPAWKWPSRKTTRPNPASQALLPDHHRTPAFITATVGGRVGQKTCSPLATSVTIPADTYRLERAQTSNGAPVAYKKKPRAGAALVAVHRLQCQSAPTTCAATATSAIQNEGGIGTKRLRRHTATRSDRLRRRAVGPRRGSSSYLQASSIAWCQRAFTAAALWRTPASRTQCRLALSGYWHPSPISRLDPLDQRWLGESNTNLLRQRSENDGA